jgi:cystathionine gamma-synthase
MNTISVISRQPPGLRCSLYAGYAQVLSQYLGLSVTVDYRAEPPEDESPFPALLVDGQAIQPADGVILSPEDVCDALKRAGLMTEAHLIESPIRTYKHVLDV